MTSVPTSNAGKAGIDRLAFGLRGHINRFSHTVINVSDLERAVEFYEATFPVRRRQHINGPAQAYVGLGIEQGQFEGWVLENKKDVSPPGDLVAEFPARALHLVQWKNPTPVGKPYREANHVGIYRQNSLVGNLDEAYTRVMKHGGRPYGDPDGSTLEMIGAEDPAGKAIFPGMMHHCNLNVRSIERGYRFYHEVMGLDPQAYLAPAQLQPASNGSLGDALANADGSPYGGLMQFSASLLGVRSDSRSPIDVLEWSTPKPYGEAYPIANHLGIIRVAFEVDDIAQARARLIATGHAGVGPIETWDMGEFGARQVVIFRDLDGIWLELIEAVPYPAALPPFA